MRLSILPVLFSLLLTVTEGKSTSEENRLANLARKASGKVLSLRGSTERTTPIRTHSLYAPYVDSDLQNRFFDFGGSTIVNTNKHIRLTQDRASQSGWLWSRLPLAPNSFEIEFEFKVDGFSNNLFGDGFAMWLTKDRAAVGPVFGAADYWTGLGIFFDSYANQRHTYSFPRIYAIMNDGTKQYDIGGDGDGQEIGSCALDFRRKDITTKARITYFKGQFTELAIHHTKWDEWTTCFTLEHFDLPANPFLGFSAHTGDVSDSHDIISIATSNIAYHAPAAAQASIIPPTSRTGNFTSVLSTTFLYILGLLKWVALLGIVVAAGLGYRQWKATTNSKRF